MYNPPVQSSYCRGLDQDTLELVEKDILNFKNHGNILLCGDFNARVASALNYIDNDGIDHMPIFYASDKQITVYVRVTISNLIQEGKN